MKKRTEKRIKRRTKRTKKRISKLRLFALAIVLVIVSFLAIQVGMIQSAKPYLVDDAADAPECDAIMVLGALVHSKGVPSLALSTRLDNGYELYAQGKAKKILVSGDHGRDNYDEVSTMREYLVQKGVPREDIFMDHAGFNTYDSMYRAKAVFGIERLLVCTQDFHISRSLYIARGLGIDAYGYPCEDRAAYNMKKQYPRESLARVKAFFEVAMGREPKYLGDPIPITGSGLATE
ncbi:MAG: YdcF family protein [Coriobacteriia bacterium]|nr:YdcF family protein [Coriobacteriia bacterium]